MSSTVDDLELDLAAHYLLQADAILVTAGSGMSVKPREEGENVYVDPEAFAKTYPFFARHPVAGARYKTSYDCMGLGGDPDVPDLLKLALSVKHMHLQGWANTPGPSYAALEALLAEWWQQRSPKTEATSRDDRIFVMTSNVDRCFKRTNIIKEDHLYTPQGEWTHFVCRSAAGGNPCTPTSYWDARPVLDKAVPHVTDDFDCNDANAFGEDRPKCPFCGGLRLMGNVRGGDFFRHEPFAAGGQRFVAWCEEQLAQGRNIAVVEIGAGYNTPVVTRFPDESLVMEGQTRPSGASLIRINPGECEVAPAIYRAAEVAAGGTACETIAQRMHQLATDATRLQEVAALAQQLEQDRVERAKSPEELRAGEHARVRRSFGHYDWRRFMQMLAR